MPKGAGVGWENGPGDGAVVLAKGVCALDENEDVANPVKPKLPAGVNGEALGGSVASIPESIIVDDDEDVNGVCVGTMELAKGCDAGADAPPPNGEAPDENGDCDGALKPIVELPPKAGAVEVELPNRWGAADAWNGLDTVGGPNGLAVGGCCAPRAEVGGCCAPRAEANDDFAWPALSLAP
jgi:hypothetical protein